MGTIGQIARGLVVGALALCGAAAFLPAERLAQNVAARVERATGNAVAITGATHVVLWPYLGLRVEGVTFAGDGPAGAPPLLMARSADLHLDLPSLLRGRIVARKVALGSAEIALTRRADGQGNWLFPHADGDAPALPHLSVVNGRVSIADRRLGRDWTLSHVDLALFSAAGARPAIVTLSGRAGGDRFDLAARIPDPAALLSGVPSALSLGVATGAGRLSLDGRADLAHLALEGALRGEGEGWSLLFDLLEREGPALGLVSEPERFAALMTLAPGGGLHLRGIEAESGKTRIAGALDLVGDRRAVHLTAIAPDGSERRLEIAPNARPAPEARAVIAGQGPIRQAGMSGLGPRLPPLDRAVRSLEATARP